MKNLLFILLLIPISVLGKTVTVAVASNVSYAIQELQQEFTKLCPKTRFKVVLGSSGKLSAQIRHKAPYSIFISANMSYPRTLFHESFAIEKPQIYAKGALAVLSTKKIDWNTDLKLIFQKARKIAIANPKTAPYGKATKEALNKFGVYREIEPKFVYGESISQTLLYTLQVADLGFVAKSSLYSKKMAHFKEGKNWIELNPKLYTYLQQGVALLHEDGREFYEFLFSKKAKKILKKHGYSVDE